jgi:PPK2 family polyphosphate:nucleotide phosphotransferase
MNYRSKFQVRSSHLVDLKSIDAASTDGFVDKQAAVKTLERDIVELASAQDVLSAASTCALLIIFQGMDSAGKDGAIKHVMSGVNTQGVHVWSFKQPSAEELRHDYLWRCAKVMPERGRIGIFNRSYYEDVLVTRVHPELLGGAAPKSRAGREEFWQRRYEDINAYERYLARNGTHIVKFFLHISKGEQRERLLARLEDPKKRWKFSLTDVQQRAYWDQYQLAYEKMLSRTSTSWAPWHVIPSDHKWFTRVAVADVVVGTIKSLKLE